MPPKSRKKGSPKGGPKKGKGKSPKNSAAAAPRAVEPIGKAKAPTKVTAGDASALRFGVCSLQVRRAQPQHCVPWHAHFWLPCAVAPAAGRCDGRGSRGSFSTTVSLSLSLSRSRR